MLSGTPRDRIALYAALFGTGIGILLSLLGLVTTISEDSVHFFPFFCILTGLWGILGFIEAAIYVPYRGQDPSSANLFRHGKKTLFLHAVWFWGGLICSFVLYSIWNSQKMLGSSSQSFSLANGALVGEILLGVFPHLFAFGLYFYENFHPSSSRKKKSKKKSKKSKKSRTSDEESADPTTAGGGGAEADDSYAAGGKDGAEDSDLEKQPLKDGAQDELDENEYGAAEGDPASKKSARDGLGDEEYSDRGDGNDYGADSANPDSSKQDERHTDSEAYDSDASQPQQTNQRQVQTPRSQAPGTIHVETHRRDPMTGRDIVSEQDWNPDKNRYENYTTRRDTQQTPIVPYNPLPPPSRYPPYSPPFRAQSPDYSCSPVYSLTPTSWNPVPPQNTRSSSPPPIVSNPYPFAQAQQPVYSPQSSSSPQYSPYPQYSQPVSPTYSPPPQSPVYGSAPISSSFSPYPAQSQPQSPYYQQAYAYGQSPYYDQRRA
ncbi:hypothetical protein JCM5350_006794 [Sporobolomyces pararoseus]